MTQEARRSLILAAPSGRGSEGFGDGSALQGRRRLRNPLAAGLLFLTGCAAAPQVPTRSQTPEASRPVQPLELASALRSPRDASALAASTAVLRSHLTHPDWEVRERATEALERLGPPSIRYLARLFSDPDPEIAWRSRRVLARIGWPNEEMIALAAQEGPLAAPLLADVLRDRMIEKASPAIRALGGIGGTAARQAAEALAEDAQAHTRYHAARALGRIGDPQAIPILDRLRQDDDQGVRFAAAAALLRLGRGEAYEACSGAQKALRGREASQVGLYNLACLAALAGRTEEACDFMSQACRQGFRDVRAAASDPDLYDLKDDPAWQRLLMILSRSHAWGE